MCTREVLCSTAVTKICTYWLPTGLWDISWLLTTCGAFARNFWPLRQARIPATTTAAVVASAPMIASHSFDKLRNHRIEPTLCKVWS